MAPRRDPIRFASGDYNVTATLLDIDGVRQAMLRGDGAGSPRSIVSNDKAYTAMATRTDTGEIEEEG